MIFPFKKKKTKEIELDDASVKLIEDITALHQKTGMFIDRLESSPEMFEMYKDMILNHINNIDEMISMLKVEFMATKDSREYEIPDENLEQFIFGSSVLKYLLSARVELLSMKVLHGVSDEEVEELWEEINNNIDKIDLDKSGWNSPELKELKGKLESDWDDEDDTIKLTKNIGNLIIKSGVFQERLESFPWLFETYGDMVLNCIHDLDEMISTHKVEFMATKNSRKYTFSDEELEEAIFNLSSLKNELNEVVEKAVSSLNLDDEAMEESDEETNEWYDEFDERISKLDKEINKIK